MPLDAWAHGAACGGPVCYSKSSHSITMARSMQLALLLGILLVAAPVSLKAQGDEYEDGDEAPAGATGAPIDLDSNVLVGTEANFDQLIAKHTFVLVRSWHSAVQLPSLLSLSATKTLPMSACRLSSTVRCPASAQICTPCLKSAAHHSVWCLLLTCACLPCSAAPWCGHCKVRAVMGW